MNPEQFCGKNKYIVITAAKLINADPIDRSLKNISTSIFSGELDVDESLKMYKEPFEYATELNDSRSINCSSPLISDYLNQANTSSNYTLKNLTYFSNYSIIVHLCNQIGCGDPSDGILMKTDEYIPSCSPSNLTVSGTTTTSLTYRWLKTPPKCSHGIIYGYNISFQRMRYDNVVYNFTTSESFTFVGLAIYEEYCVNVSAVTRVGIGPYSERVCRYTDEGGKCLA